MKIGKLFLHENNILNSMRSSLEKNESASLKWLRTTPKADAVPCTVYLVSMDRHIHCKIEPDIMLLLSNF